MPGRFNVSNSLAALAIAPVADVALEVAAAALARPPGLPSQMVLNDAGQPIAVEVDYAHTADSLAKVLRMLRPVTRGRLIAVSGSAGERDPTKRFFFSSRRRHTSWNCDWSSDVCSSDLITSPVTVSTDATRSTSSPKSWMRIACSSYAGNTSIVSPRTRNLLRAKPRSLRSYCSSDRKSVV